MSDEVAQGDLNERNSWSLRRFGVEILEAQLRVENISLNVVQGVRKALDICQSP